MSSEAFQEWINTYKLSRCRHSPMMEEVLARLLADPGEEEDNEGGDECEGSMEVPGDLGNSGSGFAWGEGDDFSMPDNGIDVDLCPSTPQKSNPIPPKTPIPAKVQRTGPDAEANLLYQQWQALIPRLMSPFLSFISATHGKKTFPLDGWYDSLQVQIEQELEAVTVAGDAATPCSSETNPATITTPEAPIPKQLTPDYSLAEPPLSLVNARGFYSNAVQLALDCGCLGVREQFPEPSKTVKNWLRYGQKHFYTCDSTRIKISIYVCNVCYADQDVPRGADFIVTTDGNFSQRHRKDAGDCPEFYRPEYFLTKAGLTIKMNMDHYDDGGVMALVCHHDAPLFLANLDTPALTSDNDASGCLIVNPVQYFIVPLPFLQESTGIHRNPQEWNQIPQDSTGMELDSAGFHRNRTGIHRNRTGMNNPYLKQ
ncbi:uncharacterized protein LACBIDRAFT_332156 [Laccaria bicolor S238N-H82]|uniref:Predicted protein n=1 Tax=Laccaria bicolor (strain S238N-H82 / ATCC MYA-4686) TaxID=486041 RepID=B0DRS5_LACBS|nr:uncharacterized protein LACBIDRAFT_332156 [Laccaria bicolor S238N-H82]EDR02581.1 predicted protein [Laccaria bicolor S238N-H82]|eukprot:XP_001886625.1 predicted protein [Laccaria bicolor S238N-H82]